MLINQSIKIALAAQLL